MKIVAVYNIKGGVGKTAATVNLAYAAQRRGLRALIWDIDPQGASTFYFRVKHKVKGGAEKLVQGKRDTEDYIKGSDYERLDIIPSDFSYRNMDLDLDATKKRTERFARFLKPLRKDYDLILIDCPPSISLVIENVFEAAEAVLVPVIPTTLSARTFDQLRGFKKEQKFKHLKVLPFLSMVDRRKAMHRELTLSLLKDLPNVMETVVPNCSPVERMGLERAPVATFAPRSAGAVAYERLLDELLGKLEITT